MTRTHDGSRSMQLRELADALSAVTRRVAEEGGTPLDRLVHATLEAIPAARAVSLTVLEHGGFRTEAWTDELARRADVLQYDLGCGPCVDAVLENTANISGDVSTDQRWAEWGTRVAAEVGVHSVLAYRLVMEGDQQAIASLNLYAQEVDAFDEQALHLGVVLATHGSLLMTAVMARDLVTNLVARLQGNREVGIAMGVLMHRHQVTREQAFDLLRLAGQEGDLSLAEVATSVADTGDVTLLGAGRGDDASAGHASPAGTPGG